VPAEHAPEARPAAHCPGKPFRVAKSTDLLHPHDAGDAFRGIIRDTLAETKKLNLDLHTLRQFILNT
jgi:hypothetical protein